jgi:hypothetical protein
MKTLRRVMRCSLWLLLTFTLIGCYSYISKGVKLKFQSLEEPFSVTVYPVNIVKGPSIEHDEDLALRLMAFLREENLANPVLGAAAVEIPVTWRRSQPKMAQQSAIAFATEVKATGVQTEYALLVEILCNPTETKVGGVHFYLSDRSGNLANGGLTNSHWPEFQEVQPHDRQGGYEVAIRMLRREWKRN